ncbi:hypothetical protein ABIA39_007537 [Nocardia sp. GAS34]|uniref:hypothetical protein n=1 Tax=unclassified Nocardia TaxID=2637762 RepID=UPI003D2091F3
MNGEQSRRDGADRLARPTAVQKQMLKEIHTIAAQGARILEGTRGYWDRTGRVAPTKWFAAFTQHAARGRELEALARAGGVPSRWIDYARTAGERADRWGALRWPVPEPVDRLRLIDNLASDARRLGDSIAVHAAYGQHALLGEPPEAVMWLERALVVERERIHSLAALLGVDETDQHSLWPSRDPGWPYVIAEPVNALTPTQLQTRWREITNGPLAHAVDQVHLLRSAGIGTSEPATELLPPLPQLTRQITHALHSLAGPTEHLADTSQGTAITAAVDAALPEADIDAPDREGSPNHTPRSVQPDMPCEYTNEDIEP